MSEPLRNTCSPLLGGGGGAGCLARAGMDLLLGRHRGGDYVPPPQLALWAWVTYERRMPSWSMMPTLGRLWLMSCPMMALNSVWFCWKAFTCVVPPSGL